jgi:hypothetical protein
MVKVMVLVPLSPSALETLAMDSVGVAGVQRALLGVQVPMTVVEPRLRLPPAVMFPVTVPLLIWILLPDVMLPAIFSELPPRKLPPTTQETALPLELMVTELPASKFPLTLIVIGAVIFTVLLSPMVMLPLQL